MVLTQGKTGISPSTSILFEAIERKDYFGLRTALKGTNPDSQKIVHLSAIISEKKSFSKTFTTVEDEIAGESALATAISFGDKEAVGALLEADDHVVLAAVEGSVAELLVEAVEAEMEFQLFLTDSKPISSVNSESSVEEQAPIFVPPPRRFFNLTPPDGVSVVDPGSSENILVGSGLEKTRQGSREITMQSSSNNYGPELQFTEPAVGEHPPVLDVEAQPLREPAIILSAVEGSQAVLAESGGTYAAPRVVASPITTTSEVEFSPDILGMDWRAIELFVDGTMVDHEKGKMSLPSKVDGIESMETSTVLSRDQEQPPVALPDLLPSITPSQMSLSVAADMLPETTSTRSSLLATSTLSNGTHLITAAPETDLMSSDRSDASVGGSGTSSSSSNMTGTKMISTSDDGSARLQASKFFEPREPQPATSELRSLPAMLPRPTTGANLSSLPESQRRMSIPVDERRLGTERKPIGSWLGLFGRGKAGSIHYGIIQSESTEESTILPSPMWSTTELNNNRHTTRTNDTPTQEPQTRERPLSRSSSFVWRRLKVETGSIQAGRKTQPVSHGTVTDAIEHPVSSVFSVEEGFKLSSHTVNPENGDHLCRSPTDSTDRTLSRPLGQQESSDDCGINKTIPIGQDVEDDVPLAWSINPRRTIAASSQGGGNALSSRAAPPLVENATEKAQRDGIDAATSSQGGPIDVPSSQPTTAAVYFKSETPLCKIDSPSPTVGPSASPEGAAKLPIPPISLSFDFSMPLELKLLSSESGSGQYGQSEFDVELVGPNGGRSLVAAPYEVEQELMAPSRPSSAFSYSESIAPSAEPAINQPPPELRTVSSAPVLARSAAVKMNNNVLYASPKKESPMDIEWAALQFARDSKALIVKDDNDEMVLFPALQLCRLRLLTS
ncbi:hypothetical protein HDU93_003302 [Gonapodya sp. JEL0774]|nr:hypothetical protein HDU93_003302 [Gonapodya sp. JEL0774]